MLVLSLLMLNLCDLFDELIPLLGDLCHLSLVLYLEAFDLLFEIIELLCHALHLGLVSLQLELCILVLGLSPVHLLFEIILVIDILDSLFEHVINRIDGLLDVLRFTLEQVSDRRHSVLYLGLKFQTKLNHFFSFKTYLFDVVHFVDELSHHKILIVFAR